MTWHVAPWRHGVARGHGSHPIWSPWCQVATLKHARKCHAPASARARVAHEHDGRGCSVAVAASPALANVGAARLLAHSRQLEFTQL
eukprot:366000-Chlamydomonas_euryale.AAC.72